MKIGIDMGTASNGKSAMLDLEELLATRLLVQGMARYSATCRTISAVAMPRTKVSSSTATLRPATSCRMP